MLRPEDYDLWPDPEVRHAELLNPLPCPYPHEEMTAYAASVLINNPANDRPRCIEPMGR